MDNIVDLLSEIRKLTSRGDIVSCPLVPVEIPGSNSSGAYTANDAMGTLTTVVVPRWGIIVSATFYDLDYEGTQVDLEVFNRKIAQVASEDAWTLSDSDAQAFIMEINFFVFDGHTACYTSQVNNIGRAYTALKGKLYVQAVTRSTPTIAAAAKPRFQLQIQSFDPAFKES